MKKSIFMAVVIVCLAITTSFSQTSRALIFQNNLGTTINGIYLQPTGVSGAAWSQNIWTGDALFQSGSNFNYTQSLSADDPYTGCLYDIKYTGADGKDYYLKSVDLCSSTPIIFSNAVKSK